VNRSLSFREAKMRAGNLVRAELIVGGTQHMQDSAKFSVSKNGLRLNDGAS